MERSDPRKGTVRPARGAGIGAAAAVTIVGTSATAVFGTAPAGASVTVARGGTPLGTATADGAGVWSYTPGTAPVSGDVYTASVPVSSVSFTVPIAPVTFDVASVAALLALAPSPGDIVRLQRGVTYAGPITLPWSGSVGAPITITTYGSTSQPAIVTGTPAPDLASPNYVDALTLTGSNVVVDGGTLAGGQLGLWIRDSGRAGIMWPAGKTNLAVLRTEISAVGLGISFSSTGYVAAGNYVHDLVLVKNTDGGTNSPAEQVAGEPSATAWDDDDYGANAFGLYGSNGEIGFNRVMRDLGASYDYGSDGGAFEFFPLGAGTFTENVWIHDNWIEGGDGVIEGGGQFTTAGVRNLRFEGNVCVNNRGALATIHNGGGSFGCRWQQIDIGFNTVVELQNTSTTRQTIILDNQSRSYGSGYDTLEGFVAPYGIHDNIIYLNDGKAVFKQAEAVSHRENVFWLLNGGTGAGKTHLYDDWTMTLGSSESYADPLFVDIAGRNFGLQAGSPAAGKGATAWTPVPVLGIAALPADYRPPSTIPGNSLLALDGTALLAVDNSYLLGVAA